LGLYGDAPDRAPARWSLAKVDRVDLGRGDTNRAEHASIGGAEVLVVALPDGRMSSQHARLSRLGGAWILEDLGSKNGTWLGAKRLTRHQLVDGDAFVIGHTVLVFRDHGGEAADHEGMPDALAPGLGTLSPALAAHFAPLAQVIATGVPLELAGESGTGKELVARMIHEASGRRGKFVAVHCSALSPAGVESFRSAEGGTLFVDEIGELSAAGQASLVAMIQDGAKAADVRVIVANKTRTDVGERLGAVFVELPPLRTRREDLGHLITTLLARLAPSRTFSADAVAAIYAYAWPSNLRELERALAAALAVARDRIELSHLPPALRGLAPTAIAPPRSETIPYTKELPDDDESLKQLLVDTIARHNGNLAAVSRELGKDRTQIRRWMKRFGLSRSDEDDVR
jgi:DNA-binding NtrC family response regulator